MSTGQEISAAREWTSLAASEPEPSVEIEYRTQRGNTLRGWLIAPGGNFWLDEFEREVSRASVRDWREVYPTIKETP